MADSYQVLAICMLLVAISCVSRARDCIPVHGYESCACYFPAVNDTREYVNLLPLKTNSPSPRYVLCSLCKDGIHFSLLKHFRKPCLRKFRRNFATCGNVDQIVVPNFCSFFSRFNLIDWSSLWRIISQLKVLQANCAQGLCTAPNFIMHDILGKQ